MLIIHDLLASLMIKAYTQGMITNGVLSSNPFKGGYRIVSLKVVEDLIMLAVTERLPASVLRLWCALVASFYKKNLQIKDSLILDPTLRRTMTSKALGIKQIATKYPASAEEFFTPEKLTVSTSNKGSLERKDYHTKLPYTLLKYLSLHGTFTEIIFSLIAVTRMMRRRGHVFRINQVEWSKRVGVGRNSLSRAINRLIGAGLIERIRSPLPVVRSYGNQYQFTSAFGAS